MGSMVDLVRADMVTVAQAIVFMVAMTLIGVPVATAWASLRGRAAIPAVVFVAVLAIGLLWIGGAL